MRILVVEDDLEAQRYLVQGLKESGHVVDEAGDGETGLSLALSRPYDVAVIDRMLPGLDGLKVVAEMREHGNGTPVLFLSALSEVDEHSLGCRCSEAHEVRAGPIESIGPECLEQGGACDAF